MNNNNNVVSKQRLLRPTLQLVTVLTGLSLLSAAWAVDTGSAKITSLSQSKVEVKGNGVDYTDISVAQNLVVKAQLKLDAGISGRVMSYSLMPTAKVPHDSIWAFGGSKVSKTYKLINRPKTVNKSITMTIQSSALKTFAVKECNRYADKLRGQGKNNEWIFNHEHNFDAYFDTELNYSMSGVKGETPQAIQPGKNLKITCKKVPPSAPTPPSDPERTKPLVKKSTLTILESGTLGGDCRLKLSGVIETSEPNKTVKFRYENDKGKKSNLKTVKTDHASSVMFSHEYPIAGTGLKTGKIRIRGRMGKFKSAWSNYSITCNTNAPGNVASNVPPAVELKVTPATYTNVNGHNCIDKLWITGKIIGKGNQSGRARFTGTSYISPYKNYSVTNGSQAVILESKKINWGIVPVNGFVNKNFSFKFNVENENDKLIASTPLKQYTFTCGKVQAGVVPGIFPKTPAKVNSAIKTGPTNMKSSTRPQAGIPVTNKKPNCKAPKKAIRIKNKWECKAAHLNIR